MTFTVGLFVGLVALILLLSASAALGRRRTQHPTPAGRTEQCEVCGAEISIVVAHLVTDAFDDDHILAAKPAFGGTGMSAAYCSNHCPGGCRQGCAS